ACWDWRFLSLIVLSTIVDYTIGLALLSRENKRTRSILLWLSVSVNLGLLGFFKYYNFFLQNFIETFSFFGIAIQADSLKIILPVGISFYTFQTLSYTIDIYKKRLQPTKDFIAFAGFVSFFPQLVAGPIERASNLLPQFLAQREFNYPKAVDGMRQILWGLFKKVVIADNCAEYVDLIFNNPTAYSGSTLVLGAIFFAFQIYGDFSGYSDIAIGTARLFGFDLMQNFAFPYFSRDMAEFWRRWHISLSTWFRDYLYIPLGGSRGSYSNKMRNTFVIFIVSGFWHGANWTFIIWGALNAICFLPLLLTNRNRKNLDTVAKGKLLPSFREAFQMLLTFCITVLAWIFFRAESAGQAMKYIEGIFQPAYFTSPDIFPIHVFVGIAVVTFVEWVHRERQHGLQLHTNKIARPIRWGVYLLLSFSIAFFMGDANPFIYFQF
ncbi:MAG: MBOAT family protein, partial [Bacteroidetes bacterium]|nr:MBOAT family protein [Bacteroidota bacterium]